MNKAIGNTLKVNRIKPNLDVMFGEKINMSDLNDDKDKSHFYSRSIAALSLIMKCGITEELAAKCITDGFADMGIDAIYNDINQKKVIYNTK